MGVEYTKSAFTGRQTKNRLSLIFVVAFFFIIAPHFVLQVTTTYALDPAFEPRFNISGNSSAGGHPDLRLVVDKEKNNPYRGPEGEFHIKQVDIQMDKGVMGNPQAGNTCSLAEAGRNTCPPSSRVGELAVILDARVNTTRWRFDNYPTRGGVYLAPPEEGRAAGLWFVIDPTMQRISWTGCYLYLGTEYCEFDSRNTYTYDLPTLGSGIPAGADKSGPNTQGIDSVNMLDVQGDPVVVRAEIDVTKDLEIRTVVPETTERVEEVKARLIIWNPVWRCITPFVGCVPRKIDPITLYHNGEDPYAGYPQSTQDSVTVDIKHLEVGLFGTKGASQNQHFLTNSTDCGPDTFSAEFTSWPLGGISKSHSSSTSLDITDCDKLPFAPQSPVSLSTYNTGDIPKIDIAIKQTYGEAHMKRVSMTLPKFFVNVKNLSTCDDSLALDQCPAGSNLGTVSAKTPISPDPFTGNLYLRSPRSDGTLGMTISLKGRVGNQDIPIELPLSAKIDAANGVVSATSNELPQVPISEFAISIDDKAGGSIFRNPDPGTYPYSVSFEGYNGATYTYASSVTIGGTILGDPDAELSVALSNKTAKANTALEAEYELKKHQKLKSFKLGLGSSKKNTLKASTARVKRLSRKRSNRRKGIEIGKLSIGRKRQSRSARLLVKNGRIKAQMSKATVKSFKRKIRKAKGTKKARLKRAYASYRKDLNRLKVTIKSRYLQIKRLPTRYKLKKVNLSLAKRGRLLRNPSKKGTVTFVGSTDGKNVASDKVKIRRK